MAIVLVIIGLLVGMGAGIMGLLIKRVQYNQTRERLDANVEAVVGEAQLNRGCIPAQDNGSTGFGYCNDALRNRKDAWREDFLCLVADEVANYNDPCSACARRTTSLIVHDDMDGANHTDIAFVIVSGGPNMRIQTGIVNTSGNTTVHIYSPGDEVAGEEYDDLVRYVTLTELKTKLKCEYVEENLRILNNDLPSGYQGSPYDAAVYAEGGVSWGGEYEWCVREGTPSFDSIGIDYDCGGPLSPSTSCNCTPRTGNWRRCAQVDISGTPTSHGTYPITFHVCDREGNEDRKSFVVSISSAPSPGPCSSYQVKNVSGQDLAYNCSKPYSCFLKKCYKSNGPPWPDDGIITILSNTDICDSRDSGCSIFPFRSCYEYHPKITFSAARTADSDGDCKVDYDGSRVIEDSGW